MHLKNVEDKLPLFLATCIKVSFRVDLKIIKRVTCCYLFFKCYTSFRGQIQQVYTHFGHLYGFNSYFLESSPYSFI